MVAKGWGWEEGWRVTANGYRVFGGDDERVLKLDGGSDCTTL